LAVLEKPATTGKLQLVTLVKPENETVEAGDFVLPGWSDKPAVQSQWTR
jgi:hypothetical protein